jgi:hypothetical protein
MILEHATTQLSSQLSGAEAGIQGLSDLAEQATASNAGSIILQVTTGLRGEWETLWCCHGREGAKVGFVWFVQGHL